MSQACATSAPAAPEAALAHRVHCHVLKMNAPHRDACREPPPAHVTTQENEAKTLGTKHSATTGGRVGSPCRCRRLSSSARRRRFCAAVVWVPDHSRAA